MQIPNTIAAETESQQLPGDGQAAGDGGTGPDGDDQTPIESAEVQMAKIKCWNHLGTLHHVHRVRPPDLWSAIWSTPSGLKLLVLTAPSLPKQACSNTTKIPRTALSGNPVFQARGHTWKEVTSFVHNAIQALKRKK
ncbi:hypothetical protein ElyMa_000557000 [Elysia marginata]|uniref:Uncharacterized protein n=1 Tax=Elysia marginata TaxID=1093978 RepID=A0AAV4G229_9GAST|nr:hypothetical protein ElyMa_000557000 [Elysia marginata]